ncbi:MAG: hypothetical protein ACI9CV_001292 [Ilumatobacter sp.]|jgi:hypothetical protein
MSNEDAAVGGGAGTARRSPRQGSGGSPVGSTLSIVLAVVAVIAGFLILRNLTQEDSSAVGTSDPSEQVAGASGTPTTIDVGVVTTEAPATTTTTLTLVTAGAIVVVANGNTLGGSAGRMTETLVSAGYTMGTPVDAGQTIDDSIVYFDPANTSAQAVGESVGRTLGNVSVLPVSTPAPTENGSLGEAGVLVVLGNNQADKTLLQLAEAGGATGDELGSAPAVAGDGVVAPADPNAQETTTE